MVLSARRILAVERRIAVALNALYERGYARDAVDNDAIRVLNSACAGLCSLRARRDLQRKAK